SLSRVESLSEKATSVWRTSPLRIVREWKMQGQPRGCQGAARGPRFPIWRRLQLGTPSPVSETLGGGEKAGAAASWQRPHWQKRRA
ncbi:unnamed protein product, partial [Ectocarpus sp. 12 AP-2014]